jgi:hypothetical protein
MARLYLLFFLLQRYQRINDNLINALIYQVRKVLLATKVCLQERLLSDRMEGSKNVQHIGQIIDLFLDESIADSVSFGEIKRRAFPSWKATKSGAQRTSSAPLHRCHRSRMGVRSQPRTHVQDALGAVAAAPAAGRSAPGRRSAGGDGVNLQELVNLLEAARGRAPWRRTEVALFFDTN